MMCAFMYKFTRKRWFSLAKDSINKSAPLLENSYRPAINMYNALSKSKS